MLNGPLSDASFLLSLFFIGIDLRITLVIHGFLNAFFSFIRNFLWRSPGVYHPIDIVGRGDITPYFIKTLLYYLRLIFQILSNPLFPVRLQPPRPLLILLSCFFGWMGDRATFDVLFYLMIPWIYRCWVLWPWCVFHATRLQASLCTLG